MRGSRQRIAGGQEAEGNEEKQNSDTAVVCAKKTPCARSRGNREDAESHTESWTATHSSFRVPHLTPPMANRNNPRKNSGTCWALQSGTQVPRSV